MAVVAGVTLSQARSAVADELVDPAELSWVDALALRVALPVQTMLLSGESDPRNVTKLVSTRTSEAVRLTRDAAAADCLGRDAVLVVGRTSAAVHPSLADATSRSGSMMYADGVMLALPVGQWWSEFRWRPAEGA